MQIQLRKIQSDQFKGESSEKTSSATDELQYLMNFNSCITQCIAKTMEHLSEFVFINVANMTLARRDAYLAHVKAGIKRTPYPLSDRHLFTWINYFLIKP